MAKSYLADLNLLAVSANAKETALNTEQTLDTSMLISKSNILSLDRRSESNKDELTGLEEADTIYDLGNLSSGTLDFEKAQAQHFGFGLSFALGNSTPAAYGSGYKHTILPTSDLALPTFTAAMRLGETILKRRFESFCVDQLTANFTKDAWAKLSLTLKGTGKYTDSVVTETITAAYNATSLTLAANAVQGSTAAERLASIHQVRCLVPSTGEYKDVAVTAASGATPGVLTITAPGGAATSTTFEVLYAPTESDWESFPARVVESPLRVTDLQVTFGGKWNGTAFLGGRTMSDEIESVEYTLANNTSMEYRPGGTGSYANYLFRQGREQKLKLNRQMRDYILQQKIIANESFGVRLKATGAEFDTGKNYSVDMIFPKCSVLTVPISVNGKILAEAGDIQVLQDATHGSAIMVVANKVSAYGA